MPAGAVATVALAAVGCAAGLWVAGRPPRPAPRAAVASFVVAAAAVAWACVGFALAASAVVAIQSATGELATALEGIPDACGVSIPRIKRAVATVSDLESVPAAIEADAVVVLVVVAVAAPIVGAGIAAATATANAAPAAGIAGAWGVVLAIGAAWARGACDGPAARGNLPPDAVYMFYRCRGCGAPELIFGVDDGPTLRACDALPPAVKAFMTPGALEPEWSAVTAATCTDVPAGFAAAAATLFVATGVILAASGNKNDGVGVTRKG